LQMLKPNYAWAIQVPPDDKRIRAETQTVPSPQGNGSIKGYMVRPADETKLPAVLVIHENRGLNPDRRSPSAHLRPPVPCCRAQTARPRASPAPVTSC
jgi:hypothetical protein